MAKRNEDTNQLIVQLVAELPQRSPSFDWQTRYWTYWAIAFTVVALITLYLAKEFPTMILLPTQPFAVLFLLRSVLWFTAFAFCAQLVYLFSIPLARIRTTEYLSYALIALLILAIWGGDSPSTMQQDFWLEAENFHGPCGFFIALTGLCSGALLVLSQRRGLVSQHGRSGAWTLAAAGAMTSFFMQLACRYESPAHVWFWHVMPIVILVFAGQKLGRRLLC